ncbi:uncharacterized protein V6R79_023303 [Siganus canaliculatus]
MEEKQKMMIFLLLIAATVPSSVLTDEWKASVVKSLRAVVTSCVVVPCSFTYPDKLPTARLRAIWHRKDNWQQIIYQKEDTGVLDNFKGRTSLLGKLGEGNCTLEIVDIKDHDNGDFCFRIELTPSEKGTSERFSFVEDCFSLEMLHGPPKPTVYHQETAVQDQPFSVLCRVPHTCPSHRPTLIWNRGTADQVTSFNREVHTGTWEEESILTITPGVKDDQTEITCTAQFFGKESSSTTVTLHVKRTETYNHIIIPAVVGTGIAAIFAVFCILMMTRYKNRIAELQRQEGSVWNRLSRLSRRTRS